MNKFKFYFFLFCSVIILFSCNKADSFSEVPIRDFDVQYQDDNAIIEDYLKKYYIPADFDPNQDVTISKIDNGQTPIWDWKRDAEDTSASYPQLLKKAVVIDDTTYYIYYLKLRKNLETGIAPSRVDAVLTSYKGSYLSYTTETVNSVSVKTLNATQFEYTPFPTALVTLDRAIRGWAEIFPFFKAGTKDPDVVGQPTTYSDFGAGVVFIPSGFAYFNQGRTSPLSGVILPSYSPLVFSFKLYKAEEADQDEDGVLSNDEDLNGDDLFDKDHDDTDGDGVINMYDTDDDGDGYYTKNEIHKNADGSIIFEDTDGDGIANYLDADNH